MLLCDSLAAKDYEVVSSRRKGESSAIVCIKHGSGMDCNSIAEKLEAENIVVSPRNEILRISPHFYNNAGDIERLVSALP